MARGVRNAEISLAHELADSAPVPSIHTQPEPTVLTHRCFYNVQSFLCGLQTFFAHRLCTNFSELSSTFMFSV